MIATYPFDTTAVNTTPSVGTQNTQKNIVLSFTLGDQIIKVEPTAASVSFEVPAKVLRNAGAAGSGLVPTNTGKGPHQDYLFMRDSLEYSYTTRALVGGSVVEKIMPVGAVPGMEGRMILYKGCTDIKDCLTGNWTARLIRPFTINATDLQDRESGWPSSGSAPTVDVASKSIVDNGGDGYNHV